MRWVREFLRGLAAEGRTVLVSSHHIAELALAADHAVIIGDGRLVADGPVDDLTAGAQRVRLRSPETDRLTAVLRDAAMDVTRTGPDEVVVAGAADAVGRVVAGTGIAIYEMRAERLSLEDAFLAMTTQGELT